MSVRLPLRPFVPRASARWSPPPPWSPRDATGLAATRVRLAHDAGVTMIGLYVALIPWEISKIFIPAFRSEVVDGNAVSVLDASRSRSWSWCCSSRPD